MTSDRWPRLALVAGMVLMLLATVRDKDIFLLGLGITAVVEAVVVWFILRHERRRVAALRAANRCLNCGYDLTGNASRVCPECGEGIVNETNSVPSVSSCSEKQEKTESTENL